ncbi:molybdopterin-guanine dinucleotide biosynthesis protein A [Nisaea acidiphila]|uniref:Molybdopterin-guanine dinucleotide biosynthesis protein A n=1 Tax=Nisaea acidiphila TaxID=1862145 RepID=A0A9J7AVP8_9PROT|nr:molybdopterin-guanine dinucleotide biosynthesis protein A [Nisaea acidiphila]UUX50537.1 molybdopterin-guanine dinucleotide biosynthesis protein A [Nisaea acidiphila]
MTAIAALLLVSASLPASASSRHAGYYYPDTVSEEQYVSKAQKIPQATRESRLAFVSGVAKSVSERPYPPQRAMFAKGGDAEKLIIVSLYDDHMTTLAQARAVLALMTNVARTTKILRELQVESLFNFLDFCKMLGFTELTISDGRTYAHRFVIE